MTVIPGLLDLVLVHNRGAAFGFLNRSDIQWQFWLFLGATVVAAVAIVALLRSSRFNAWLSAGLGLVLGGALGNLVDRIRFRGGHRLCGCLCGAVALARLQRGGHGHLRRRLPGLHRHLAHPGSPGKEQGEKIMTFAWWHVLVALIPILPNFWSIWHIWNHRFSSFQQKAIWLVIAVFLPVLGGLIYIFAGRKHAGEKL